jgi:hypothetical protein
LERLKHQQMHVQQQQQPRPRSRDWQAAEEDEQSDDEMLSTAPVRYVNTVQAHQEPKHRRSPSPAMPSEEGLSQQSNSKGQYSPTPPKQYKSPREQYSPTPGSTGVSREDRRGSKHSSCAGSRVSAATATTASTVARAKYQPYPGQAALVYNPKTAPKTTSYLHGEWTRSLVPGCMFVCAPCVAVQVWCGQYRSSSIQYLCSIYLWPVVIQRRHVWLGQGLAAGLGVGDVHVLDL